MDWKDQSFLLGKQTHRYISDRCKNYKRITNATHKCILTIIFPLWLMCTCIFLTTFINKIFFKKYLLVMKHFLRLRGYFNNTIPTQFPNPTLKSFMYFTSKMLPNGSNVIYTKDFNMLMHDESGVSLCLCLGSHSWSWECLRLQIGF